MSAQPELTRLTLGFIPLTDCAPLVVAHERGLFEAEGLQVVLSRESSWANVRDRVAAGLLDGAHMLGPMPIAASLGVGGEPTAMIAPMALNLNGSGVTVSRALAEAMRQVDPKVMNQRPPSAAPLRRLVEQRAARGERPLTFAVVFPYSIHTYQLRYWMAAAGIDPDRDVRLVVIPPPGMAACLRRGELDGFCVGAPWNHLSAAEGDGEALFTAAQWWGACPDKVLGTTLAWAERYPNTLQALLRALLRAAVWAEAAEHAEELAGLLARPAYVDAPAAIVARSLSGPDRILFDGHAASFPWRSHALWFASQMVRWGQAQTDLDFGAAASVYRPDLYRQAAEALGRPAPLFDSKIEGAHAAAWTLTNATWAIEMGADRLVDGTAFDPADPLGYAQSFAVDHRRAPPA